MSNSEGSPKQSSDYLEGIDEPAHAKFELREDKAGAHRWYLVGEDGYQKQVSHEFADSYISEAEEALGLEDGTLDYDWLLNEKIDLSSIGDVDEDDDKEDEPAPGTRPGEIGAVDIGAVKEEAFDPWTKFGEVMKEVSEEKAQKEANDMLVSLIHGDDKSLIEAGIPKEFIDGTLKKKLLPDIEHQMRLSELGELEHDGYVPSTELNKEVMDMIVSIAKDKIDGKMPADEDEYYNQTPEDVDTDQEPEPDEEPTPEPPTSPELNPELVSELSSARDEYARLTAERRGVLMGGKEALEAAKKRYETALQAMTNEAGRILLVEMGLEEEEVRSLSVDGLIREQTRLQAMIRDEREKMSEGKKLARFYNWFGRQNGFKGTVKKALAMGVVGVPIGLIAGTVGVAVFGPFGGAIVGAGLGRGVMRGLASAKVNKEASAMTHAEAQEVQDTLAGAEAIRQYVDEHDGRLPTAEEITKIVEARTKEQHSSSVKRAVKMATAGAIFGALGAVGGAYINHHFFSDGPKNPTPTRPGKPAGPPAPKPPVVPVEPTPAPAPLPPVETVTPSFDGYKHPWDWAVDQVGGSQAKGYLESLAQKAAQAGHRVQWHNMGTRNQWLEIDGVSEAPDVIKILNEFKG